MDIFYPQGQQGQQYDHGFLLIPGNIVDNRQIIDIFQSEDFFQLQGDHCQRVAVIALSGIQYPGNSPRSLPDLICYICIWHSRR